MKFVSSKKISEYAEQLHDLQEKRAKLRQQLRAIESEIAPLEFFLKTRTNQQNFQFANHDGYLMETQFIPGSRQDIDDEAVRRHYAKLGKDVPMKTSTWVGIKVKYIYE